LIDVKQSSSAYAMTREQTEAAPLREVQDVVSTQAGAIRDPTGLYIRGGRAYAAGYDVDGVSAKDPRAASRFVIESWSYSCQEVEVTTGGIGAEFGDVTSGVVSVETREGGNQFTGSFSHKRDNFGGLNDGWDSNFNEDIFEMSL